MAELGKFALQLGLFLSGYAILVDLLGSWRNKIELIDSGRNATIACFACLTVAITILCISLIKSDFSIIYVAENTSKALPLAYKISALWAGAAGSLLLWLWLQVGFVAVTFSKTNYRIFSAYARTAANMVSVFFLLVLILDKNPFATSTVAGEDGAGLNPLLQHPAMALHPPALFIGYAAFIIPFSRSFVLLKTNNTQGPDPFLKLTHSWILSAWLFLTIGIALGGWWAYEELGWGGYWSWDPVENSSLLPWLTATALLHCSRIYRRNTSIEIWLIVLSLVTFSLCIFGTFLTRYGLVSSVHAFPEPGLGILFMVLIALIWIIAAILLIFRYKSRKIKTDTIIRKSHKFIVLNNWLLLLLTFLILAGTLFPFLSSLFSERTITLKAEYFTKITAPLALALLLFIAICTHLLRYGINKSWRIIGAALTAITALGAWLISHKIAMACFILCAFAILTIGADLLGVYFRRKKNGPSFSKRNLRWYSGRIVHIGVVLVFLGIAGSSGYGIEKQAALKPNDKMTVDGFEITYNGISIKHGSTYVAIVADISVHKNHKLIAKLTPSQAFYYRPNKRTGEVDIKRTLAYDLYVALTEVDNKTGLINLAVLVKPLINWIWIGCLVTVIGVIIILVSFLLKKTATSDYEQRDES
jgi:cytochrome c-type biogenesis protein CcmF